jgi:NLI interacting factor-like phosphatase
MLILPFVLVGLQAIPAMALVGKPWSGLASAPFLGLRTLQRYPPAGSRALTTSADANDNHPASDLKVFLSLDCLVKTKLLKSLSSTEEYEQELEKRSQGGFCDYMRVPPFENESSRFYDNYVVVEKRHGLAAFLETICPQYQVHLITDKTKLVATAIVNTALSPLKSTQMHAKILTVWVDDSGLEAELQRSMHLPRTVLEICKDQWNIEHYSKVPEKYWSRIVLVDSDFMNHASRPANGVLVPEFTEYECQEHAEQDDALSVVATLLHDLEPNAVDVQKVLVERFDLCARLQPHHEKFWEFHGAGGKI